MLMNRMMAMMAAVTLFALTTEQADAQVVGSPFYGAAPARSAPVTQFVPQRATGWGTAPVYYAPVNQGCANGMCRMTPAMPAPAFGGSSYGRPVQPTYYRVPTYRPASGYAVPRYSVPGNAYPANAPVGYGRPVIINSPAPSNGGYTGSPTLTAPNPRPTNGAIGSPFYP